MATVITAGNATNGLSLSADNTGAFELKTGTGAGTTALTLSSAQIATFAGATSVAGNMSFNSGYGSAAVAYGCRAWVNFNGTANTNLSGTYSQSGTTVTVTATAHGLIVGNTIYADITTGTGVDGIYSVATVTDANTFTYTAGTSLTTSGNITLVRSTIRASGNVSSITDNAVGDYTVNFATAMPDVNYAVSCSSRPVIVSGALTVLNGGYTTAFSQTTSAFRVQNQNYANSLLDTDYAYVSIFR